MTRELPGNREIKAPLVETGLMELRAFRVPKVLREPQVHEELMVSRV